MIVLDKQQHELEDEFRDNVYKLLQVLIEDLHMLPKETQLTFQQSLNLNYLHEIASETGKNHLKAIEQCFQDKQPDQAMAGIQTNHFLYTYIEMLHRIWCFVCDVESICTWPAFNSTMQMHHNIIAALEAWQQKCKKMIKEQKIKLENIKAGDEEAEKIQDFIDILSQCNYEIFSVVSHMKGEACLKYAGDSLESMKTLVMQLWFIQHEGSREFSNSLSAVFLAYCQVKCHDNKDNMPNFIRRAELEVTEVNVKTVTQAMLIPSDYLDVTEIGVPALYRQCVDDLFTVETGGNVVLSKDPICQQIINQTLTNFGIILRHNSSLDDLEDRQKCVKASLGIITNSSDNVYLHHYRKMPFQRHKIQGSWDITLDTESSLEKITMESLHPKHALNMFFDDDGLDLPESQKKYLLRKFISSRFFEFCKPLTLTSLTTEQSDKFFNSFQQDIFVQRYKSCKLIVQIESTDDDPMQVVRMYERLYGTYDGCEQSIALQIQFGNSSNESQEGTKMKTEDDTSRGYIWAFIGYIGTKLVQFTGQKNPTVSQPPDATFESGEEIDIELQKAQELKEQAKQLETDAKNERNEGRKSDYNRQSLAKKEELHRICTRIKQFLQVKRDENMSKALELRTSDPSGTETSFLEIRQKFADELKRGDIQLRQALDLLGEYGTWSSYAKPSEVRTDPSLMPFRRDSGLNEIDNDTSAQSPSQPPGTGSTPHTLVAGSLPRNDAPLPNTQTPVPTGEGSMGATRVQTADVAQGPAARASANAQEIALSRAIDFEQNSKRTGATSVKTADVAQGPAARASANAQEIALSKAIDFEQKSKTTRATRVKTADVAQGPAAGNAARVSQDKQADPVANGNNLEQNLKPAIAAAAGLEPSDGEQLLPIARINDMETKVSQFKYNGKFVDADMYDILGHLKFTEIFLPKTMKGFDGSEKIKGTENEFKSNIVAYFELCYKEYVNKYYFLPAHAFVLVNSTENIRTLARRALVLACNKSVDARNNFKSLCMSQDFKKLIMPNWINEKYLSDVLKLLQMPKSIQKERYDFNEDPLQFHRFDMFQRGPLAEPDIKLKVRYILYIGLAEKGIQELEADESEKTRAKQSTPAKETARGSSASGLFTQPLAWCDHGADEGPPESARVCCRCGMCTRVEEKTDFLAYHTAPPTHPLLNACSTHPLLNACSTHPLLNACSTRPVYSAPSTLVWTAVPMGSMGPGIQARRVYILQR
jgi:hypothetical protein